MADSGAGLKRPDLVKALGAANTQFGLDLYKMVSSGNKDSNLFLSPFSISAALGMTHLGAKGDTAQQMTDVLKWGDLKEDVHQGFEDYLGLVKASGSSYTLTTANRLYVNNNSKILDSFLSKTYTHYKAKAVLSDFAGNGDAEAKNINEWVESETNSKIKDLITGGIDPLTAMIIINAIYFKGNWAQQFDPSLTSDDKFKVTAGKTVSVNMMRMKKKFNYGYNDQMKCKVLELPYINKDLSMFFLLPFDDFGLDALEQFLNGEKLNTLLKQVRNVTVDISMPRFVLESSFTLNDALKSLGMKDAFDQNHADLTGIDGSRLLYISKVIHKTFLEVNEEGAEAAAATAIVLLKKSRREMYEVFQADHPFLFLIRDNRADLVLFIGRLIPTMAYSKPGDHNKQLKPLATANANFAKDLLVEITKSNADGNLFMSPFSILSVLSLALSGARDQTSSEMITALRLKDVSEKLLELFQEYTSLLAEPVPGHELCSSNNLYVRKDKVLCEKFLSQSSAFRAKVELCDFVGKCAEECAKINMWVSKETNGKIKDVVNPLFLSQDTAILIVNAIYFKGTWHTLFDPYSTVKDTFTAPQGQKVTVDMMTLSDSFKYQKIKDLKCASLELPYKGNHLSMVVLLPDDADGLAFLESNLNSSHFQENNSPFVEVNLSLPRFKMESDIKLTEVMQSLGMETAFDFSKANFTGIDPSGLLYVSNIIHKSFVEVNEYGTEAAAATVMDCCDGCVVNDVINFKANHPFLFFIRDDRSGMILFLGRLVNPEGLDIDQPKP